MPRAIIKDKILDVSNLTVSFGDSSVLKELNFSLRVGDTLGIVGESGSGKSITALSIMGLLPPGARKASGSIILTLARVKPVNLLDISEKEHTRYRGKHLAIIFQEPMTSLNPSMRCGRQVEEAIALHQKLTKKEIRNKCLALFEEMQLPDSLKIHTSYPHQLSGGQKQRVMIAMALAGNPSILIADEPTTALDVTVQKEIISLLKLIVQKRGMGLIFISHDLGVISEVTNYLLVLKDGHLVEEGLTCEVLTSPKNLYTRGLIACRPPLDSRPPKLPTVQDLLKDGGVVLDEKQNIEKRGINIYSHLPILSVRNLEVDYVIRRNFLGKPTKTFKAVNNLSFNLFPGETLGLVGESGCGKTTLGRALLGLVNFDKGTILYKSKPIKGIAGSEKLSFRREVQFVFQDPYSSLNPRHTIGETIMEPLKFHRIINAKAKRRSKAMDLLEQVSLPSDSFYRYPHEFSGGQRQRVAIARALALNPKVLVCDEMVSALDVSVQAQILNLLNQLKRDFGLTYIFISHDLSVVKYMSNRMLVMQQGEAAEYGSSDEIYANPKSEYTLKLISAIPGRKG